MEIKTITVTEGGERLDSYLSKSLDYSRSKVQKLIDNGFVTVDNKTAKAKEIGSDYIVVGRPITQAENPVKAYRRCVKEFVGE